MSPADPIRRVGLSLRLGSHGSPGTGPVRAASERRRVLIAADCSAGRGSELQGRVSAAAVRQIDIDRFSSVATAWRASWTSDLRVAGNALVLAPRDLDDLHPDAWLRNVPVFAEALRLRDMLARDPSVAPTLAALLEKELSFAAQPAAERAATGAAASSEASAEAHGDTLSRLLGAAPRSSSPPLTPTQKPSAAPAGKVDVQALIRSLVGASSAAPSAPDTSELVARTNQALGEALRTLLRDPTFRALEATWLGIDGLLRHSADPELLEYAVLDASLPELAADAHALGALLREGGFSSVLIDHSFRPQASDLLQLLALVRACAAEQIPLLTGAHPSLAGCASFDEAIGGAVGELDLSEPARAAWTEINELRAAGAQVLLALPRFLLRQPYGSAGEPLSQLAFEEILRHDDHEAFAWGNGAYLLERALGELHARQSDPRHPDGSLDLRELPIVHLEDAAGVRVKPCAETCLSERTLGRLRAAGFSVLQGLRDSDRVRVHF
jgi:type VI secretion system (T6SS) tail sheath-like EvpB family protein